MCSFLWSFKKDKYAVALPAMQQHVRIEDFVPQARVLQHNNTLVFLSHCGQNSMLEAISTGTPILALPLIGDQVCGCSTPGSGGGGGAIARLLTALSLSPTVVP